MAQLEIYTLGGTRFLLDGDSFERFVNARDTNFFGGFEGYEVLNQQIDKGNGVARITKRLLFDGIPQIVMTLYDQHDQSVFSIDFWSDVDLTPVYSDAYEEIINTSNVDGALAASVFHSAAIRIPALKKYLIDAQIAIRPPE